MHAYTLNEETAVALANYYIAEDDKLTGGKRGEDLRERLIGRANDYDGENSWQAAMAVHQKLDEVYPDDLANKLATVNYIWHYRKVANAVAVMQSIAKSYIKLIYALAKQPEKDVASMKLVVDMLGNMTVLIVNNHNQDEPTFTEAQQHNYYEQLIYLLNVAFEDIKACFAVGDAALAAFPDNEELQAYIQRQREFFYPLYKIICQAKTDVQGKQYWYTEENAAILKTKEAQLRAYKEAHTLSFTECILTKLKTKFLGPDINRHATEWQKLFHEKSTKDFQQLAKLQMSFNSWQQTVKDILKAMNKKRNPYAPNYYFGLKTLTADPEPKLERDAGEEEHLKGVSNWDLVYNSLYYWHHANVHYALLYGTENCKQQAPTTTTKATQIQPQVVKTYASDATMGLAGAGAAAVSYITLPEQDNGPTEEELHFAYEYAWHPDNIHYQEEEERTSGNHDRLEDDQGYIINGKWVEEHQRNLSNPGSVFDSLGYAKNTGYEEALKDDFYMEKQEERDFYEPRDEDDEDRNSWEEEEET